MSYDAVLLDYDGVLVELTGVEPLKNAVRRTFHGFGVESPPEETLRNLLIDAPPEQVKEICEEYGVDATSFWRRRERQIAHLECEQIRAGRKACYDDVATLRALDRPQGVISNNLRSTVDFALDHFDMRNLFDTVHAREPTLDSLTRKKPDPYHLERAITALDVESPIYVGDSDSDVEAAARAGIDAAFIRRPERSDYELTSEPTYEITTLADLPELLDD